MGHTSRCLPPWKPPPKRPQFTRPAVATAWPLSWTVIDGRLAESGRVDDDPPGADAAPGKAADPGFAALAAGLAATSFPLPADKTDGKVRCAAGASDRSTLAAVAGMINAKARTSVVRTTGRSSSFFTGSILPSLPLSVIA